MSATLSSPPDLKWLFHHLNLFLYQSPTFDMTKTAILIFHIIKSTLQSCRKFKLVAVDLAGCTDHC